MNEFALSHGRVSKGIWSAFWASLKFVIIPLALIMMLDFALMEVASGLGDVDTGLDAISENLDTIMVRAMIIGIPLVALAFFRGFYPRGSNSRLAFGIVLVAGTMLWLWWITFGGHLDLVLSDVSVSLNTSALLGLFLIAIGLRALIFLAEWKDYRSDFLLSKENGELKAEDVQVSEEELNAEEAQVSEAVLSSSTEVEEVVEDDKVDNNESGPEVTDI